MADLSEPRLVRAQLRMELREIDARIADMHRERKLYRRMKFAQEFNDVQLAALIDERQAAQDRLVAFESRLSQGRARQAGGVTSWLMLPPLLGAMVLHGLRPRSARSARPNR